MKKTDFLQVDTYKFIEIVVKNGRKNSGHRILKLAAYHEEINEINWFLVCWYKFRKLKVTLIIGLLYYEGSYKITVACLPVRQFGIFLRNS